MTKRGTLPCDNGTEKFATDVHPLLTTFAVGREDAIAELPGRYCLVRDVWVVDSPDGEQPIVERALSAFTPITKVQGERSDIGLCGLLEVTTKTSQQLERDDFRSTDLIATLELVTRTATRQERDDR